MLCVLPAAAHNIQHNHPNSIVESSQQDGIKMASVLHFPHSPVMFMLRICIRVYYPEAVPGMNIISGLFTQLQR